MRATTLERWAAAETHKEHMRNTYTQHVYQTRRGWHARDHASAGLAAVPARPGGAEQGQVGVREALICTRTYICIYTHACVAAAVHVRPGGAEQGQVGLATIIYIYIVYILYLYIVYRYIYI